MRRQDYFSKDWARATVKFVAEASRLGTVKWQEHPDGEFHIPYVSIGAGADKIVINSGVHGAEGYLGSAVQIMIMRELIPNLSPEFFEKYTLVLIHVINGWGMENGMREVIDARGGLVDLNRNFGVDFARPELLPKNELYKQAHDLLLSPPDVGFDGKSKYRRMLDFRKAHSKDGVWASISRGQYDQPAGLFYGGSYTMPENEMTMRIYDEIMHCATSLMSIGLHTGVGRFYKNKGYVATNLQVSHEKSHPNTVKFTEMFQDVTIIEPGISLLGDLVDALESRYAHLNIPVYTADFETGTDESPTRSPVLRFMDRGNARYEMLAARKSKDEKLNPKNIRAKTARNLLKGWYYADNAVWRKSALENANLFFRTMLSNLSR
ncbi:MAG: DUF2817 domain-containing protein [Rickettsiales bacterium]|jgi:hypothetical protein|nr:DUF2817 domain-containing protein [Rickettsiales bacterium]